MDTEETVLKTFNDYQDDDDLSLIEIKIDEGHSWCDKTLKELALPSSITVLMIRRNKSFILPKGPTKIYANDVLVLGGAPYRDYGNVKLREEEIDKKHHWVGKKVKDIFVDDNALIAVIRRGYHSVIPSGETVILTGDQVIICSMN